MAQNTPGPPQDLGLFDQFNTQDVSTAPTSEREDPLTLDDIGDFLNSEIDIKEEAPVTSIVENHIMDDMGEHVIIPQVGNVKTESEELIEEVVQLDSDGAPIFETPNTEQQPNSGLLRIRSFAMDPDTLCVLPSNPPATRTSQAENSSSDFAQLYNIQSNSDDVLITHDYATTNNIGATWENSGLQTNPTTSQPMMMQQQPPPNVMMAQSEFYPGDLDNEVEGVNHNQPNIDAGTALSFPYISMQVFFSINPQSKLIFMYEIECVYRKRRPTTLLSQEMDWQSQDTLFSLQEKPTMPRSLVGSTSSWCP